MDQQKRQHRDLNMSLNKMTIALTGLTLVLVGFFLLGWGIISTDNTEILSGDVFVKNVKNKDHDLETDILFIGFSPEPGLWVCSRYKFFNGWEDGELTRFSGNADSTEMLSRSSRTLVTVSERDLRTRYKHVTRNPLLKHHSP